MSAARGLRRSSAMVSKRAAALLLLLAPCVGCAFDTDSVGATDTHEPEPEIVAADVGPSRDPLLVHVDADRKLTALPGESTAVFIEYGTGGKWHVSWTCDPRAAKSTLVSGCFVHVAIASESTLSNTLYDGNATSGSTAINSSNPKRFEAQTLTNYDPGGITFTSDRGKINGGFDGPLTDPLRVAS